jgi:thioredoxin reductase
VTDTHYDVLIVGGGPAGLSAALTLGRCRRRVALCDDNRPRNAASRASHGFFTRDGVAPDELRRIGREQLAPYDVALFNVRVVDARRERDHFVATTAGGNTLSARMLLLATGLVDELPAIDGLEALYGTSVFHCPFCDGWEVRDRPLAVHGRGARAVELALALKCWSDDVALCSDGFDDFTPDDRERLDRHRVILRLEPIERLEADGGELARIRFASGDPLARRALFFCAGTRQRSDLVARLGCELDAAGCVVTGEREATSVPGLYVAGDASRDAHFIAVAAAEGMKAATAVHQALREADIS